MPPREREIAELGLSFVVSAGWMPGLTELLPIYAHRLAKSRMDSVESLSVYFSDSGEWSDNALRDGAWYLRQAGLSKPGFFRKGDWVHASMSEASGKFDLSELGIRRFGLFFMPELQEVGRRLTDCEFRSYSYLSGLRNALAAMALASQPLPESAAVKLLRGVFRRNRLPLRGFVMVCVLGLSNGRRVRLSARVAFGTGEDYWMNGVVLATTARMIVAARGVETGVHFLFEAVDPLAFMAELGKAGVQQTETIETCNDT